MPNEILTPTNIAGLEITRAKQRSPYLNMLIYAEAGTGKTVLAGSASVVPQMSPVLICDVEGGSESLKHMYPDVHVVRTKTFKSLNDVYNELATGHHPYKTVVIDSGTEVQRFSMGDIMDELVTRRPDLDPDIPSKREYGKNLNQMRRFMTHFRDLDMHTIVTALVNEKQEDSGAVKVGPKFTGQFAGEAPAIFDVVMYYYIKEITNEKNERETARILLTQKMEKYIAKNRTSPKLPLFVENPDMKMLYELMTSGTDDPTLKAPDADAPVITKEQVMNADPAEILT